MHSSLPKTNASDKEGRGRFNFLSSRLYEFSFSTKKVLFYTTEKTDRPT